jgi:uncharacterized protein YcbK (DUF882 family)
MDSFSPESCLAQSALVAGLPLTRLPLVVTRRAFLLGAGAALALPVAAHAGTKLSVPDKSLPVDPDFWSKPRELWLSRLETNESARVVYWQQGAYKLEEYVQLCRILRDTHADNTVQMDPVLLNVLAGIQAFYKAYGWNEPITITSGFRTVATNNALRSEGAARNSMHLYGKAADITLPGIPVWHLGRVKQYLSSGGVGFYPTRHFVHVDTGSSRSWNG